MKTTTDFSKTCPLCSKEYKGHPAISRVDNQTPICPTCGTRQALEGLGLKPDEIEKIKIGDVVKTHKGTYEKVVNTMINNTNRIINIKTSCSPDIKCTLNHPFLVYRNNQYEWIKAKDLNKTDKLCIKNNVDSDYIHVSIISLIQEDVCCEVYNLEVENEHTYCVNNICVHNCQDWSNAGLNNVNTGRSILFEKTLDIIEHDLTPRPKVVIWENVKGLLNKKNKPYFDYYIKRMEELGYKNSFDILNSLDFGIPQSRERVFIVSIRKDIDYNFDFDKLEKKEMKPFIDFIDKEPMVETTEYDVKQPSMIKSIESGKTQIIITYTNTITTKQVRWNNAGILFKEFNNFYTIPRKSDGELINGSYNRVWKLDKFVGTIPASKIMNVGEIKDNALLFRYLTPRECFRLMGYDDVDYNNILLKTKIAKNNLYQLAGNSIVVDVLEAIFKEVLKNVDFKEKERKVNYVYFEEPKMPRLF